VAVCLTCTVIISYMDAKKHFIRIYMLLNIFYIQVKFVNIIINRKIIHEVDDAIFSLHLL